MKFDGKVNTSAQTMRLKFTFTDFLRLPCFALTALLPQKGRVYHFSPPYSHTRQYTAVVLRIEGKTLHPRALAKRAGDARKGGLRARVRDGPFHSKRALYVFSGLQCCVVLHATHTSQAKLSEGFPKAKLYVVSSAFEKRGL